MHALLQTKFHKNTVVLLSVDEDTNSIILSTAISIT